MFWSIHNACCLDNWLYKRIIFLLFFFFLNRRKSLLLGLAVKQGNQGNPCVIHEADTAVSANDTGV